jgi:hypothetical protein
MDVRLTPAGLPSAPAGVSSSMLGALGPGESSCPFEGIRRVCEDLLYEDQVLLRNVKQMIATFEVDETLYWMVCENCGTWVSTELIGPDGAGETDDGSFCCTSCRFGEDYP